MLAAAINVAPAPQAGSKIDMNPLFSISPSISPVSYTHLKKQQKQDAEKRKQQKSKQKTVKEKIPEKTPDAKPMKEVKKQAPKKNEPEGQMSLFDLL